MRGVTLAFLVLLCACSSRGANGVGSGPPGIDVADAALRGGSPEIALDISNNILATNAGNQDALLTKGEALTALGRNDEAGAVFQQVLAANPGSVGAAIGLGRLKLSSDPVAAEALFLQAVQHEPRNATAWNDLGIARDLQGRHTDAQAAYRSALGINPDMNAAEVNLALSMAMSGHAGNAAELLRPLASKPDASKQVRHDLAAVLTMGGDKAEASSILSKDLPPDQVQQALAAYASAGSGGPAAAAALLTPGAAPPASATPASVPAGVEVQLAASPSEGAARAEWQRLEKQMPSVFGNHQPVVSKVEKDGKEFWRLRTGGFATASDAKAFCEHVQAGGASCMPLQ